MGRTRKLKDARAWERVLQEALKQEATEAKKPCDTCAMKDPEAWIADPAMGHKLRECLTTGKGFYCHEGMEVQIRLDGTEGAYQPPRKPDGSIDVSQMTPCGGFLRWAAGLRLKTRGEQIRAVQALQRKMCAQFLQSDRDHAVEWRELSRGRPTLLQDALTMQSLGFLFAEEES